MQKERLDVLLVNRGFFKSREKARSAIMAGVVFVDNNREDKCGSKFSVEANIFVKENINPYVSRGGLKLAKAIETFGLNLDSKVCLDVGASTGGFTDCMLKNGAKQVFAIDVGYGQLAWELRSDERVVCMERTNIRNVRFEDIKVLADFASIDVSFISLKKVLPVVHNLISDNGEIVCLIKPQFEAGRDKVGKKGVVRDKEVHKDVVTDIVQFSTSNNLYVKGISYSPIKGPEGNIEYLLYLSKSNETSDTVSVEERIHNTIEESHQNL